MPPLHTGIVLSGRVGEVPSGTLVVPLLGARRRIDAVAEGRRLTAELISEATGEPVSPDEVELLTAHPADIMMSSPPTPTLVRHPGDLEWYRGLRVAWATDLDRSWRPVVCYTVGSVAWERIIPAGTWQLDRADRSGAAPPETGARLQAPGREPPR